MDHLKCLVVVSHPDDESIWMGGTILRKKDWDWHLLVLCRADDADREPRFRRAVSELGVDGHISDLDDSPILAPLSNDLMEIKQRVTALNMREFDLIFTHGPKGEYTFHARHGQAHKAIHDMIIDKDLTGKLVTFSYQDFDASCWPRPSEEAEILIKLTREEFACKQHILRDIYNFGPGSFEFEAAGAVEAFEVFDANALAEVKSTLA